MLAPTDRPLCSRACVATSVSQVTGTFVFMQPDTDRKAVRVDALDPDGANARLIDWMLKLSPTDRLRCAEAASRLRCSARRVG